MHRSSVPAQPSPATVLVAPLVVPRWRWLTSARAFRVRHPDLAVIGPVLLLGLLMRLALLYRIPPLFMPGDSQSFLTPGYDLARGLGFDPILKRPLGYPVLIGLIIATIGEDLRALVFVQAMLGLVTVAATYWIGRLIFGRAAGALAALAVAIGGQLLIYEHYVLAESVFGTLVTLAVLALVIAARNRSGAAPAAVLGGIALTAASLFRPIAEVIVPIAPIYFLIVVRPTRRALVLSALVIVGFVGSMVPVVATEAVVRGGLSSGAVGEHLLWRITRSDSGYISRDDVRRIEADPAATPAQRYVVRKAAERVLPQEIFTSLRRELGLSAGEADSEMRGVALDAISRQPGRYLASTLSMTVGLFLGEDQQLGETSKRDGEARYINPQARQRSWFEDRVLHFGAPPDPAVQNEFDNAEALTTLYQPGRARWLLVLGCLAGIAFIVVRPSERLGLLLVLAIPAMLLANAALAGPEARFRYPIDPLIGVVAAGGLTELARMIWNLRSSRHIVMTCERTT